MDDLVHWDAQDEARWLRLNRLWDGFFFLVATAAAAWLLVVTAEDLRYFHWAFVLWLIALWATLAYLILPRIHRMLTTLYVPDYFIGRARTSVGLLGDPINLAFDGTKTGIEDALANAGWTRADPVTLASSWKIILTTLARKPYPKAPVSPLFLFGRQQDFAYQQEVHDSPAKRHHVRVWKCPPNWPLPGGQEVGWLAAATFDRRVGLSLFTLQVTHKIAADTDVERDHVLQTLEEADPDIRVRVLERFSTSYHARNGGGDAIETDGNLPIVTLPKKDDLPPPAAAKPSRFAKWAQRPPAVYLALLIVILQVIPPVGLGLSAFWDPHDIPWVQGVTAGIVVLLAIGLWEGLRIARLLLMGTTALSIIPAIDTWWHSHSSLESASSLISVSLSVALLLAVSSPTVSQFAEQRANRRAANRKLRHEKRQERASHKSETEGARGHLPQIHHRTETTTSEVEETPVEGATAEAPPQEDEPADRALENPESDSDPRN